MADDIGVRATTGVVGGELIQFVEGRWPGQVGDGLAVSDEGFDLIEPSLCATCSDWTSAHRYGVFELTYQARSLLVKLLRDEAAGRAERDEARPQNAKLLSDIADWLDARPVSMPISILGY